MNFLLCAYACFLLPTWVITSGFISHVRFSKFMLWFFWFNYIFKLYVLPYILFKCWGLNKPRLCKLVLMFRFLWISAGPTYSALLVNAKEVSDDVRFRRKLLFHWLWIFRCSYTCSCSSGSKLCLLSIFTHSCVYLAFRYLLSSHFMMSVHTFLRFIKQVPRLNNSLDIENYHVFVWTSLKFIWSC